MAPEARVAPRDEETPIRAQRIVHIRSALATVPNGGRSITKKTRSGNIRPERLAPYDLLIATVPAVERKGDTVPYASVNGNMFRYLFDEGSLALRLAPPDREAVLTQFSTSLHVAFDVVQKEYVDIPGELLADTPTLAPYFAASYAYASSLRPEPTTRRAKDGG